MFKVRTKFANSLQGHTAVYSRSSSLGIGLSTAILYLIIGIVLARIIDKAYRSYYQRKNKLIQETTIKMEKELENGRKMRVRNEQLSLDVDTKVELAVSAMSLNKK
jgi:hypothetical protein